jgi:hypothetical protein
VFLNKERLFKLTALALSLASSLAITEIAMRAFLNNRLKLREDERNLTYRFDEALGWFPVENSRKLFRVTRTVEVAHNSRGFRDSEHILENKPRMIFIGDSYVWGYDIEKSERFTEKLREKLPAWSIYNLGVSGYGTDQEYLLLKNQYGFYKPNLVFLLFCTENDIQDNTTNLRYGGYFKPYFVASGDNLKLSGIPIPKSENYFFQHHKSLSRLYWNRLLVKAYFGFTTPPQIRIENPTQAILQNMNAFVREHGGSFLVGLTAAHPELEGFLRASGIPYVDLSHSDRNPENDDHWTPEGHLLASERIHQFLINGRYLQDIPATEKNDPAHLHP